MKLRSYTTFGFVHPWIDSMQLTGHAVEIYILLYTSNSGMIDSDCCLSIWH